MKFNKMKTKELRAARNELQRRLSSSLRASRIINLTDAGASLEGGSFPATYNHRTRELSIWGRASRMSGSSITIEGMQRIQDICERFFDEYQAAESYDEINESE